MSEQDVIDVLNILDPNKAVGPDIISNKMLIAVKNEVAKPLSLLFNKSFQCKIFPNNWKIAFIIPLFKRGDKSLPSNYRSVSLLLVGCPVLKKTLSYRVWVNRITHG